MTTALMDAPSASAAPQRVSLPRDRVPYALITRTEAAPRVPSLPMIRVHHSATSLVGSLLSGAAAALFGYVSRARTEDPYAMLSSLRTLERGWDGYDAAPPNSLALELTRWILDASMDANFPPVGLAPSVEEGTTLTFLSGAQMAAIECYNSGELFAVMSDGHGDPTIWEIAPDADSITEALSRMRDFLGE
jgi:hypothetical protein